MQAPVSVVERSQDGKLSTDKSVSTTWVSQASCPTSCPFKDAGCYAQSGRSNLHTMKLNQSTETDVVAIAKAEAEGIRGLSGRRPLRLHVVGDCPTAEAAQIVAEACAEHTAKHGKTVWSYTHAAHEVPREAWGSVSILGSCQSAEEADTLHAKGYAPAIVVSEFQKDTAYKISDTLTGIPCPHQTGKVDSCVNCRLCWNADKLHKAGRAILFAAHGSRVNSVKRIVGEHLDHLSLIELAQAQAA